MKADRRAGRGWSLLPLVGVAVAAVWLTSCSSAGVDEPQRTSYTEAQADAGEAVYLTTCASCHLTNFQGAGEAPALAGPDFLNTWGPQPVAELLELVRTSMPPTAPQSLSDEEYTEVVAYLLSVNGVGASGTRLTLSSVGPEWRPSKSPVPKGRRPRVCPAMCPRPTLSIGLRHLLTRSPRPLPAAS